MTTRESEKSLREEQQLRDLLETIEPAPHRLAQIEEVVVGKLPDLADRQSLVSEWIELLRIQPLMTTGLAFAGSSALLLLSPATAALLSLLS